MQQVSSVQHKEVALVSCMLDESHGSSGVTLQPASTDITWLEENAAEVGGSNRLSIFLFEAERNKTESGNVKVNMSRCFRF
jgi:hypothetical protein